MANKKLKLDEYEKDILTAFENNELVSLSDAEISRHQAYAKNTLKKFPS